MLCTASVNPMYVCMASIKYSKKHSVNLSVTDMSRVCDICATALWQFQTQICNRHVTDLFHYISVTDL